MARQGTDKVHSGQDILLYITFSLLCYCTQQERHITNIPVGLAVGDAVVGLAVGDARKRKAVIKKKRGERKRGRVRYNTLTLNTISYSRLRNKSREGIHVKEDKYTT